MKRRIFSTLLATLILLPLMPAVTFAADNACGNGVTWDLTGGVLTISKTGPDGSGAMADYDDLNCAPWHDKKDSITTVIINSGVTSIGNYAFDHCAGLTAITIPESTRSIGENAFYDCTRLASVEISPGLASIGRGAFHNCSSLTSIDMPSSLTSIGLYAFELCNLTSVTIPSGITAIPFGAFQGCRALTTVTIPKSVTSIGKHAFTNCSNLKTVYYSGSSEDWDKIHIDYDSYGNIPLKNATVNYGTSPQITFDVNGGDAMTPNTVKTNAEGKLTNLPSPTRNGYIFNGWYDAPTGGNRVTTDTKFTADATVYAQWAAAPAVYTVFFDTQGGPAIPPISVAAGGNAVRPADPVRTGFAFGGWYREGACVNVWNFGGDAVTGDMTLYAKWTAIPAPSSGDEPSPTSRDTVPMSGEGSLAYIGADLSGPTATVSAITAAQINRVIEGGAKTGVVEIDFTGLGRKIRTVNLPAAAVGDIAAKARSGRVDGLSVKLSSGEISFDANALSAIEAQAGRQLTLALAPADFNRLSSRQKEAVGSTPVYDLTLRSGGKNIADLRDGRAAVSLPHTPAAGLDLSGITVYRLDSAGGAVPCATSYDTGCKSVLFTADYPSLYFVGYNPAAVWANPHSDVAGDAWYYDAVWFVRENGLMDGFDDGRFGPNDRLFRAQFVQILYNREGRPAVTGGLRFGNIKDKTPLRFQRERRFP